MTDITLSRVYQILTVKSEDEQFNYGLWILVGWDCADENCLYFANSHGGQLHVPIQDTETGKPKPPWVVVPIEQTS